MRPTRPSNGRPMTFPKRPRELKRGRCSRSRLRRWQPTRCGIARCSTAWPACASSRSSADCEPAPRRPPAPPAAPPPVDGPAVPPPPLEAEPEPAIGMADDDNPFTPDVLGAESPPAGAVAAGVTIVPRKSAVAQGKRAARAGQRELDLVSGEYRLPPLDILALPSRVTTETKIDEGALEQNARLLETVLDD